MKFGKNYEADKQTCFSCKEKIEANWDFCPKCGNPLTADAIRVYELRENDVRIKMAIELVNRLDNKFAMIEIKNYINNMKK